MKNIHLLLTAVAACCLSAPMSARITNLLPKPHEVTATQGAPFALGRAIHLDDSTHCAYLQRVLSETGCTFDDAATACVTVSVVEEIPMAFNHAVNLFPDEAYRLEVTTDSIRIEALTPTGVIRAAQTLQQLAEGYEGTPSVETLTMTDWPAFKVRGFMHDVGRSFLSFDELKNEIDKLARFKINVFHWHLTEKLAWRFEVKAYPQLTASENMTRYPGLYYTQEQCRELEAYAAERGITVIPEIDMPGHSDVFTQAMGFNMQSDEGVNALKVILSEVVEVFPRAPYIHIGGDEVQITYPNFLKTMADYVRSFNKKVVMWNRLVAGPPTAEQCDMTQMWASSGQVVEGLPNIDCRYNYTNHFDVYADLVGIYKSNIFYETRGTADVAGTISAAWSDTKTATETDIVRQNNIYANILASAERAWYGGGKQYVETGGTTLPNSGEEYEEFADFERRFLFHKAHSLKDEPIAYVRQCNVRWRITDPFPNGGNNALTLPPEQSTDDILPGTFTLDGVTYGSRIATGAGIYLRHIWHPKVPSFFSSPANNQTAYAWTYIYSPEEQQAGAQIEFYTYSRSGNETAPPAGQWDRRGSKIWLNGEEIAAPAWERPGQSIPQDNATLGLTNENLTARPVVPITLRQGWNKVFMRLPHVNSGGTGRDKWQFTFVVTDAEGRNALEGIVYSPTKCLDAAAETVSAQLDEVDNYIRANFGEAVGYYPLTLAQDLLALASEIRSTLPETRSESERREQLQTLASALEALQAAVAGAEVNPPKASTAEEQTVYILSTPNRGNRYPTSQGAGQELIGNTEVSLTSRWIFEARPDGTFNIVNTGDGLYISPDVAYNKPLITVEEEPAAGWSIKRTDVPGLVAITSGSVQFNQTTAGNAYKVFNWGEGSNTSDDGCQYRFAEAPPMPHVSTDRHIYWYQFSTPLRGTRYPTAKGIGQALVGETTPTEASTWKFALRSDGSFNIVNKADDSFVSPNSTTNTALKTTAEEPEAGWAFLTVATEGYFGLVSGTAQFNQTNNAAQGWNVYNWGGGSHTTDTGCQYRFTLVGEEDMTDGIQRVPTERMPTDTYYDCTGRTVKHPTRGLYITQGRKVLIR